MDISVDFSDSAAPSARPSEMLRSELREVNTQLQSMKVQWEKEKRQLLGEKAALQDAAEKLSTKVRDSEVKAAKAEASAQKVRTGADDVSYRTTHPKIMLNIRNRSLRKQRQRSQSLRMSSRLNAPACAR